MHAKSTSPSKPIKPSNQQFYFLAWVFLETRPEIANFYRRVALVNWHWQGFVLQHAHGVRVISALDNFHCVVVGHALELRVVKHLQLSAEYLYTFFSKGHSFWHRTHGACKFVRHYYSFFLPTLLFCYLWYPTAISRATKCGKHQPPLIVFCHL